LFALKKSNLTFNNPFFASILNAFKIKALKNTLEKGFAES
jgi:hypothetical protein